MIAKHLSYYRGEHYLRWILSTTDELKAALLAGMRIEGQALMPDGSVIRGARFQTNLADHVRVLESECMIEHAQRPVPGRHVNWVVESLRRA